MDCTFALNTDGLWQCTREECRWVYPIKSDKPPRRNCGVTGPPPQTLAQRLDKRYEDIGLARGLRTREQVDALLEICNANECGKFDKPHQRCKKIATGCEAMERWVHYLTTERKWCEHWGPKE